MFIVEFYLFVNKVVICIKAMAPHGKELTAEQKEFIIPLSNSGYSSNKS